MKKRKGFVSNSSSCSFFVSIKDFENTKELAQYMIEDRFEYLAVPDEKDGEDYKEEERRKKNLLQSLEKVQKNENLAFLSCNFDTFITKVNLKDAEGSSYVRDGLVLPNEEYFYIATTNNITWNLDKCYPFGFNDGDCYDGLYDHVFIEGEIFLVLDNMKKIYVPTEPYYCQTIRRCEEWRRIPI